MAGGGTSDVAGPSYSPGRRAQTWCEWLGSSERFAAGGLRSIIGQYFRWRCFQHRQSRRQLRQRNNQQQRSDRRLPYCSGRHADGLG